MEPGRRLIVMVGGIVWGGVEIVNECRVVAGAAAVDYLVRKTNRHRCRNETNGNKRAPGSAIVVRGCVLCVKHVDDGRTTDERRSVRAKPNPKVMGPRGRRLAWSRRENEHGIATWHVSHVNTADVLLGRFAQKKYKYKLLSLLLLLLLSLHARFPSTGFHIPFPSAVYNIL